MRKRLILTIGIFAVSVLFLTACGGDKGADIVTGEVVEASYSKGFISTLIVVMDDDGAEHHLAVLYKNVDLQKGQRVQVSLVEESTCYGNLFSGYTNCSRNAHTTFEDVEDRNENDLLLSKNRVPTYWRHVLDIVVLKDS